MSESEQVIMLLENVYLFHGYETCVGKLPSFTNFLILYAKKKNNNNNNKKKTGSGQATGE